jgi:hypothetical protein
MVLRLNPDHPMVWRTPTSVQFGVETPVAALADLAASHEVMLEVLARGVSRPLLSAVAARQGIPEADVDDLLGSLSQVIGEGTPSRPLDGRVIAVDGCDAAGFAIASLLRQLGASLAPAPPPSVADRQQATDPPELTRGVGVRPELAVIVSHYATVPRRAAAWLRDDIPQLLVEFGDRSVRVGPVVSSRAGPCAACLEHRRLDLDPAWTAIATQASARTAPSADALGIATVAPAVARVAVEFLSGNDSGQRWNTRAVRILRPGCAGRAIEVERVSSHPLCGCRSLPENGKAGEPRRDVIRPPPTTTRGARERG